MGIKQLGVSLPLLVILVAIFQCGTAAEETGKALITKTCSSSAFPDVCTSTLESDPRTSTADLKGLSRIALELSLAKTNETAGVAYYLLNHASGYLTWAERSACFNGYNISLYKIKEQGLPSFDQGKYDKAFQSVDYLNQNAVYCSRFDIPELTEKNTLLSRFSNDVKTILHLLF
ncbi:pectinesterase inhibitor-like [Corylus avellana]|uniref:pectinesterase inhibitor-like n=1 Tax=Corylus avellana TaxID=13451 RepID=UPI00286AE7F4|nr:pectinesterase inhibitor-like [Corylus avellana]